MEVCDEENGPHGAGVHVETLTRHPCSSRSADGSLRNQQVKHESGDSGEMMVVVESL